MDVALLLLGLALLPALRAAAAFCDGFGSRLGERTADAAWDRIASAPLTRPAVGRTISQMRLRRRYIDFYLAKGRTRGRLPLQSVNDFDAKERKKIEDLSFQVESLKVLGPWSREFGHYAVYGWWRLPPENAITEYGEFLMDTTLCHTYAVAFVVQRGRWFTPDEWNAMHPGYELARVSLQKHSGDEPLKLS